ncbi:TolC family outer membrane protein [soil metagenome]
MRASNALGWSLVGTLMAAMIVSSPAVAVETLHEALANAYDGNPSLRAERARQRATDEQLPQALSGWRPTVTAQARGGYQVQDNDFAIPGFLQSADINKPVVTHPGSLQITLSQPIFSGGRTAYTVRQAESNVEAGRQNLLATEQDVLFQGTQAYMNVIRDRQILSLRQRNVEVLRQQLRAADERFNVGEVTRTDVAQARARLAQAQSEVAAAKSNVAASIASYVKIIGHSPGALRYPKLARLPPSLEVALATAKKINPNILASAFVAEAAEYNIGATRADLLPQLSLQGSASRAWDDTREKQRFDELTVEGVLTIPLYEGGRVYAAVRQAKQLASQRRIEIIETERAIRETVVVAWNALDAARETIVAAKAQVSASALALEGVKQEYLVGSRTTLDVLDAEAELLNARELLVIAERNQIVTAYQLLGADGQLTARYLDLNVDFYDPLENYRRTRNKWIGLGVKTVD